MYPFTSIPELEIACFRAFEHELLKSLEIRRLRELDRDPKPALRDRLLLTTGSAFVSFGEWLRERSRLACSTKQYAASAR